MLVVGVVHVRVVIARQAAPWHTVRRVGGAFGAIVLVCTVLDCFNLFAKPARHLRQAVRMTVRLFVHILTNANLIIARLADASLGPEARVV
jgi:hypothetical protein